jgi:hypothetical protein
LSQDTRKYTALGIAAKEGHTDLVTMLIKAGANVNHRDSMVTWLIPLCLGSALLFFLVAGVRTSTLRKYDTTNWAMSYVLLVSLCLIGWLYCPHVVIHQGSHGHSAGTDSGGGNPQPAGQREWLCSFRQVFVLCANKCGHWMCLY